ncbi:hypothetical protein AOXY_G300 [Acipenser oxyrinchus oxyrinchus]|uniref:Interleukin n=1 Tax=Acipenser oxyrinchus oxyrinchus TaxID=40147 RepID=A0AAD8GK23_ACIOX|nr:hypothetical protein AOXY_G300 [Acipenser oxyrinchus oxyrinchus]
MSTDIKQLLQCRNPENLEDYYTPEYEPMCEATALRCFSLELDTWLQNYKGENRNQAENHVECFLDTAGYVAEEAQNQSCNKTCEEYDTKKSQQFLHALENFIQESISNK